MKLYNYWRSGASWRVRNALALKGLAFEYVAVNLLRGEQHASAHRARNPAGYVPVLEINEEGRIEQLTQSVAILEYLEEAHPTPALLPHGAIARAKVRALVELMNSGIQPFHNLSTLNAVKDLGGDQKLWAQKHLRSGLAALEQLAQPIAGRFLFGDSPTFADCCLVPQLYGARRFGIEAQEFPLLARVESACFSLDAFKRAHADAQPDAVPV